MARPSKTWRFLPAVVPAVAYMGTSPTPRGVERDRARDRVRGVERDRAHDRVRDVVRDRARDRVRNFLVTRGMM